VIKQAFNEKGDFFFISLAISASVLYKKSMCTEVEGGKKIS
jgi:hypothetical protein